MNVDLDNISNADIYKLLMNISDQNSAINKKLERIEKTYKEDISQFNEKVDFLEQENARIKEELLQAQRQLKKYNIVIYGVDEKETDLLEFVLKTVNEILGINIGSVDIRDVHRIGKKGNDKPRPIVVDLLSYVTKLSIIKSGRKLKGTGLYVCPDLTHQDLENLNLARKKQFSAKIINNKLVVNGETYSAAQLKNNAISIVSPTGVGEHSKARRGNSAPTTPIPTEIEQDKTVLKSNAEGGEIETVAERIVKKRKKTLQ